MKNRAVRRVRWGSPDDRQEDEDGMFALLPWSEYVLFMQALNDYQKAAIRNQDRIEELELKNIPEENIDRVWEESHRKNYNPLLCFMMNETLMVLGIFACPECCGSGELPPPGPDEDGAEKCWRCSGRGWLRNKSIYANQG